MIPRLSLILTLILFLASCAPLPETPVPQPATVTATISTPAVPPSLDPFFIVRQRGMNMGNALEAPKEGEWGLVIEENYFDAIKEKGFTVVRIPVRWSTHAMQAAPYTIDEAFFARVDQVIQWALDRELIVIINMHHYEEMAQKPEAHEARYLALWQQISARYQAYPPELIFEPMNEPNSALDSAKWNSLLAKVLPIIRANNPDRNLVIGGAGWNSYEQLQKLELPAEDRHIIATFHYYLPFQFTHQGAEWVEGTDDWLGTPWNASEAEKAEITAHFDTVSAWAKANNRPILMGEFGAYSRAEMASRARWTDFVAREAEQHGFAWTYWEFGSGFGAYNRQTGQWNTPLLNALMP